MTSRNRKPPLNENNSNCSNQIIDYNNVEKADLCMHKIYKCNRCNKMFCSNSNQYYDALIFEKLKKNKGNNEDIVICVDCMIKVSIDKYGNYKERDVNFWIYYYSFIPRFLRNRIESIVDIIENNVSNCLDNNNKEKIC